MDFCFVLRTVYRYAYNRQRQQEGKQAHERMKQPWRTNRTSSLGADVSRSETRPEEPVAAGKVATLFGVDAKTINRWTNDGRIPEDCYITLPPPPGSTRNGQRRYWYDKMVDLRRTLNTQGRHTA